jgi:predicted RNA methylase
VALRAAEWLDEHHVRTVVDIGSGAGKFCVAAALAGRCRFTGLEQRPRLVDAARALARLFEVDDRVAFLDGALGEIPVPDADAYYLYNPFGENLFGPQDHLDEDVELSFERYARDIATVRELLQRAPVGTYVVIYNGFGGQVPLGYQEVRTDHDLPNPLCLWRKTSARGHGPYSLPEAS